MKCTCKKPGYCPTNGRCMTKPLHQQCQASDGYYNSLRRSKKYLRAGDRLEGFFCRIGIDQIVKRIFGRRCGCGRRKTKLNRAHEEMRLQIIRIRRRIRRLVSRLL